MEFCEMSVVVAHNFLWAWTFHPRGRAARTQMATPSGSLPPPSPSVYVPFGGLHAAPPVAGPFDGTSPEGTPSNMSPQGLFMTHDQLSAIQQWAEEREVVAEQLAEAEQLASARNDEIHQLRVRLAASEMALRTALGEENVDAQRMRGARSDEKPASERCISGREANALAVAHASRRHTQASTRNKAESADLRAEWAALKAASSAISSGATPNLAGLKESGGGA